MWKKPHSLIKMTLELVYPAMHKIKAECTAIQVETKRLILNHSFSVSSSHSKRFLCNGIYRRRYGKSSLADQDDRVTPSSRSSRSSDHRRSRRHSPEYDRREGRAVSRRYTDDKDYRDRSEPSPRQGRDNRDYNIKKLCFRKGIFY
ncbi:hypothetical protein Tco_0546286 [Tanacetum coccineum]